MRDILTDIDRWRREDKPIAVATVIQTWGSSPRGAGSKMVLTPDGDIAGSVSGGCVENAVVEAGIQSLKKNWPQLLHFGVSDEIAWESGLACGGNIDVFIKPLDQQFFSELFMLLKDDRTAVVATVVRGPMKLMGREILIDENGHIMGSLGNEWGSSVSLVAQETLLQRTPRLITLNDEVEIFIDVILPPPTLVIVGGVHIATVLVTLARGLGYHTIIIDPRKAWGNTERFPHVDQLIQVWPPEAFKQVRVTQSTAIVTLTHDPKLDDPALQFALNSPAFYIGALGSRITQANRRERLLYEGFTESQLERLHGPAGLDIGARSPEEIALAIMAEVVGAHRKREQQLAEVEANLHPIR
jgi:xanthine dehydrogenase accessory factor